MQVVVGCRGVVAAKGEEAGEMQRQMIAVMKRELMQ
jgi:hypothetical protein